MRPTLLLPALHFLSVTLATAPEENRLLFQDQWPKAFFFRQSENLRSNVDYEAWASDHSRLMGIIGKCLSEEIPGRHLLNPTFFARFKAEHPGQSVFLHYNGNARDPRWRPGNYFPGHFIYRKAVRLLSDVPAESGESVIPVEDVRDFKVGGGRYRNANDDLALFRVGPDGRHDWASCEQVELVSIDSAAKTIRVRRGAYGSAPRAFPKGSRVAAHQTEGPWGEKNHLLWFYNFSTACPRDREGKNAGDRLAEELAADFAPGGMLSNFDGLEFDVMYWKTEGDTDGNGVEDDGILGGVNAYGLGVRAFAGKLREALGPRKFILGDGAMGSWEENTSQRAFAFLNGIESEGWPDLRDSELRDWSAAMNRHSFWNARAFPPAFSYINHKFETPTGEPGKTRDADVPFSTHRLVFAAAQCLDAALTFAFLPPHDKKEKAPVWDEMVAGQTKRVGWLGRPIAPARRMALESPDLLAGRGNAGDADFLKRIRPSEGGRVERIPGALRVSASTAMAQNGFTITEIPTRGSELTVALALSAESLPGYPADVPRQAWVRLSSGGFPLLTKELPAAWYQLRSGVAKSLDDESGAMLRYSGRVELGSDAKAAFLVHPPFKNAVGAAFWGAEITVPAQGALIFSTGLHPRAAGKSDGLVYTIQIVSVDGSPSRSSGTATGAAAGAAAIGMPTGAKEIFRYAHGEPGWRDHRVDLSPWAGNKVRLAFGADCGPKDNAVADHGSWGDVRIAVGDAGSETAGLQSLFYAGPAVFTNVFTLGGLKAAKLNFSLWIEGNAPIALHALTVHAAPDTLSRLYENGLVLANPAARPFSFDLAALAPGRRFTRFLASPLQDAVANNGQPVDATVTLGAKDGLFLLAR